jgi:opacity protein-like surface antigen
MTAAAKRHAAKMSLRMGANPNRRGSQPEYRPPRPRSRRAASRRSAVIAPKNGTVQPYAVAGGGAYNIDVDRRGLVATEGYNNTEFGWNAGGGVAFPLGKTNVFVEARYHSINTEGPDTERIKLVPVTVGIVF